MLIVKDLTIRFGGLTAINNLSFEFEEGILGIIGPNGAGKTTLINSLSGFVKATEGSITFDGIKIDGLSPFVVSQNGIGRTFQLVKVFADMTVMENIMAGAHSQTHNLREAAYSADEIIETLHFMDIKNEKASSLTLAQQKQVELGRAMATKPKLLLLDELIAGLNQTEGKEMVETLKMVRNSGVNIIFIEHIIETVKSLSDKIMVLNFGEKIAEGKVIDVMNNPIVIEAYLGGD